MSLCALAMTITTGIFPTDWLSRSLLAWFTGNQKRPWVSHSSSVLTVTIGLTARFLSVTVGSDATKRPRKLPAIVTVPLPKIGLGRIPPTTNRDNL